MPISTLIFNSPFRAYLLHFKRGEGGGGLQVESKNKFFETLVVILVVVAAAQSVITVKLYQRNQVPIIPPDGESVAMDFNSGAAAQPPATDSPERFSPFPTAPYSGSGIGWNPFREFRGMRQQMDQMFDDSFGRFRQVPDFHSIWGRTTFSPSMDLDELNDRYIVRMDIPGADKTRTTVKIDDRELTVSGLIEESVDEQGMNYLRKERHSGAFRRTIMLPAPVKADAMEADYEDGVLIIILPKGSAESGSQLIRV